jgi:hypothetical protein
LVHQVINDSQLGGWHAAFARIFPLEDVAATHRILESAKPIGRPVVTLYRPPSDCR